MDQGYDSFWVTVKTKAYFRIGMPSSQDDSRDPCGKDRSAGRNFSSQEFIHQAHTDAENSSRRHQFGFSLTLPIVSAPQEDPHTVNKGSVYKTFNFSNYFNNGSTAIPIL